MINTGYFYLQVIFVFLSTKIYLQVFINDVKFYMSSMQESYSIMAQSYQVAYVNLLSSMPNFNSQRVTGFRKHDSEKIQDAINKTKTVHTILKAILD